MKSIIRLIKKGLIKIGLIKNLESINEHADIQVNEEMYDEIAKWKALYKGYYESWHKVNYHTVEGKKTRFMNTLNMAKVSAQEMASLVFNEKCEISIGDDKNKTSNFIDEVLNNNRFMKQFQTQLEYVFGIGGVVAKPYVLNDEIKISYTTIDNFIPVSWRNGKIYEGVFIDETHKGKEKYTLLEWHLWIDGVYTVKNELYKSDGADLGRKVNLHYLYPDLDEEVGMPKITQPIFTVIKPNIANNFDTTSPLGISLYANALPTMKAIDTAFDSLHREFRLGKKRIFVPDSMIKVVYDSEGRPHRYFDSDDETYQGYKGGMDSDKVHDIKVELRVEEHISAINALLNIFAMQTGFSSGTFTFNGQSMKTATEVVSEQSKTFKSKQSHEIIIEECIIELIESILELADTYGIFTSQDDIEISVAFDDSIAEDKEGEIDKQVKLVLNGLQSKLRAIKKIFGVTDEEAELILQEINSETVEQEPTPSAMFGDVE